MGSRYDSTLPMKMLRIVPNGRRFRLSTSSADQDEAGIRNNGELSV